MSERQSNKLYCTDKVRVDDAHVGLYGVKQRTAWIARTPTGTILQRIEPGKQIIRSKK